MANYYTPSLSDSASTFDNQFRAPVSLTHGRMRVAGGTAAAALYTTSDVIAVAQVRSSARVWALWVFGDGAATAGAVNVGLHYKSESGIGTVIDADLFGSAVAVPSTAGFTECFAEAAVANNANRGEELWQAAGLSADPNSIFLITLTPSTTFTDAGAEVGAMAIYTAQND